MKPLFTLLIALTAAATALAGSVITAVNNGNWATAATWDLNRKPQNGDTIIIPANRTVAYTTTENLNGVIIKIWGTLNMSGGGKLNLDNAGLIRVYPGATITGTGNSDQIKIGNTHVFRGADPAVVGPMYADNSTGGGFAPMSVLPVTFVNFYVSIENEKVKISWSTATETNNKQFEIERSIDGINWSAIAVVAAVGNSNSVNNYSYTDKKINATLTYYRIKQVDLDGRATYTSVKSVSGGKTNSTDITVSRGNNISIAFSNVQLNVVVKIWTANGQAMHQQSFNQSAYISFRLNNAIPGVYVVQVIDSNNKSESKKIILN
jgi:hypothetical protein